MILVLKGSSVLMIASSLKDLKRKWRYGDNADIGICQIKFGKVSDVVKVPCKYVITSISEGSTIHCGSYDTIDQAEDFCKRHAENFGAHIEPLCSEYSFRITFEATQIDYKITPIEWNFHVSDPE